LTFFGFTTSTFGADRANQQRVAVGIGLRDGVRADVAAGAAAVVDDEVVAERLREPVADVAREDVGRAAGREGHDHLDDAARVVVGGRGRGGGGRAEGGERCNQRGGGLSHGRSFRHLVG
jgi:electron transfer flavoprotein alpha subunit